MKIVAANYADSLRRPGAWNSNHAVDEAVLDSVREELRTVYGEADDVVPHALRALAHRLDEVHPPGRDRSA